MRCKSCSVFLSPWGKTVTGKKRYFCKNCHSGRLFHSPKPKEEEIFGLFRQYVLWGTTYEVLSSFSGYTVAYLCRFFHRFLLINPPELPKFDQPREVSYLLIDGLWFGRWFVLMAYRQSKSLLLLHVSVAKREVHTKVAKDLKCLVTIGYRFTGVVSDGQTGIAKAVEEVFPHIPHQICLAHMHRGVISALGLKPKDDRLIELRKLADHVWKIESHEALKWWTKRLIVWEHENFDFLRERRVDTEGRWWFIHKGARHALYSLLELPDKSFKFLDDPLMPKTTNELEAQFGHVGKRWLAHRGLKRDRWEKFLRWFVYFYNQEKLSQSKKKRVI